MTLRQKMLIKKLPENNYNISKTAKLVGYKESYATSVIYQNIRKNKMKEYLEKWFNEEQTKKEIRQALKRFKSEKDNSNYSRLLELQSKILGMQKDISENRTELIVKADERDELNRIRGNLLSLVNN